MGGAALGRLWRLLSLAADWPVRAAGEEVGADEAKGRMQTAMRLTRQSKADAEHAGRKH